MPRPTKRPTSSQSAHPDDFARALGRSDDRFPVYGVPYQGPSGADAGNPQPPDWEPHHPVSHPRCSAGRWAWTYKDDGATTRTTPLLFVMKKERGSWKIASIRVLAPAP